MLNIEIKDLIKHPVDIINHPFQGILKYQSIKILGSLDYFRASRVLFLAVLKLDRGERKNVLSKITKISPFEVSFSILRTPNMQDFPLNRCFRFYLRQSPSDLAVPE